MATQWLTQRLAGALKASYLAHQNNKYRYQAGPVHGLLLCRPRMSLIWLSVCRFKLPSRCPHSLLRVALWERCSHDRQVTLKWQEGFNSWRDFLKEGGQGGGEKLLDKEMGCQNCQCCSGVCHHGCQELNTFRLKLFLQLIIFQSLKQPLQPLHTTHRHTYVHTHTLCHFT